MKRDNIIFDIIEKEHQRQLKGIELIASENFVSDQVMQAMGSCLTNKYAEGYPGKRYYGGCEVVDQSETIAIERLKSYSRRMGQRAASLRRTGQCSRLPGARQAGRHRARSCPRSWRTSHPRHENQLLRTFLPCRSYGVNPETFRIDPEIIRQRALETHPAMIIGGWSATRVSKTSRP